MFCLIHEQGYPDISKMLDANPKTSVTHKLKRGCIKTFILIQPLLYVGMTGFEPATTRPPDAYSNRAELHPELNSGCKSTINYVNKQSF